MIVSYLERKLELLNNNTISNQQETDTKTKLDRKTELTLSNYFMHSKLKKSLTMVVWR